MRARGLLLNGIYDRTAYHRKLDYSIDELQVIFTTKNIYTKKMFTIFIIYNTINDVVEIY